MKARNSLLSFSQRARVKVETLCGNRWEARDEGRNRAALLGWLWFALTLGVFQYRISLLAGDAKLTDSLATGSPAELRTPPLAVIAVQPDPPRSIRPSTGLWLSRRTGRTLGP